MNERRLKDFARELSTLAKHLQEREGRIKIKEAKLEDREQTLRASYLEVKRLKEKYGKTTS